MKTKIKLSIVGLSIVSLLTGCESQPSNEVKVSKPQLKEYFQKSINNNAELLSKYADSLESNQNLTKPAAKKSISDANSINKKLKNNTINKKATQDLIQLSKSSKKWAKAYEDNDFKTVNKKAYTVGQHTGKVMKDLGISKSSAVLSKYIKASNKLGEVEKKLPHIEGKTAITNDSKIEITGSQMAPGYEGKKTLIVYYTATNLTNEPEDAYSLLLNSRDFYQDNGNSYKELDMGMLDTDWEDAHPEIRDLNSQGVENKLKPKLSIKSAAYFELSNDQNPILYQVRDPETREKLGTIKIPLNN